MSTPAKKRAPAAAAHPTFKDMVTAAIGKLADKKGSSRHAIRKYIAANYKVTDASMKANLNKTLKKLIEKNYLAHPKNSAGKYKIAKPTADQAKVAKKPKTVAKKKPAAKKADKDGAKKAGAKKPKAKKASVKKTTAKKSTVKKTTKKAAVKKPASKKSPKKAAKKPAKKAAPKKK